MICILLESQGFNQINNSAEKKMPEKKIKLKNKIKFYFFDE
jgi:hypothetical protein